MKLKKVILTLSAVCVLSFGAAALLLHSVQSFAASGDTVCNVNRQATGSLNGIKQVNVVNKTSADVRIIVSGTADTVSAHLYGTISGNVEMKPPRLSTEKNGNTRTITASREKNWQKRAWFNVHYRTDLKLDITVPETYAGSINVVTASGDVESSGFHGENMDIQSSSGDVDLNDFSGKTCKINTASGDVEAKNIQAPRMDIKTASGDIVLTDSRITEFNGASASGDITIQSAETTTSAISSASGDLILSELRGKSISASSNSGELNISGISGEKLVFNTTSGDIRLRKISGNLKAYSTSGDIKAKGLSFPESIRVFTTSGDIQLSLSQKIPFAFEAETNGEISFKRPDGHTVMAEKSLTVNCGGCKRQVSVQSVSGDIEVR
ncbi:MAG: DUF4097 domain-containing protein [Acidobacteria bacterium]|nr:DUF4097 domain-containing protein [Acidobacteriota bacterium]